MPLHLVTIPFQKESQQIQTYVVLSFLSYKTEKNVDKFQIFGNIFILRLTNNLTYIQKLQYISLCLLLMMLPFSKGLSNTFAYITVFISILNIYVDKYKKYKIRSSLVNISVFLGLSYSTSIFWSNNLNDGINFILNSVLLILIPIFFIAETDNKKLQFMEILNYALIVSAVIILICNIIPDYTLEYYSHKYPKILNPYETYDKQLFGIYSPFIERIQWGNLLGITCILNMYYYIYTKKIKLLIFSIILGMVLLFSGSRGTWIAILMATITALVIYPSSLKTKLLFIFMGIVLLLIVYKIPYVHKRILQARYEYTMVYKDHNTKDIKNYSSIRRLVSWQNSITLIKKNVLFGTGIGDYKKEYQEVYISNTSYKLPVNNHSQWFHIIGNTGIVGLIIVLFGLIIGIKNSENKYLYIVISIFYITVFTFDAILLQTTDCILFAIMYSALFHGKKTKHITS